MMPRPCPQGHCPQGWEHPICVRLRAYAGPCRQGRVCVGHWGQWIGCSGVTTAQKPVPRGSGAEGWWEQDGGRMRCASTSGLLRFWGP